VGIQYVADVLLAAVSAAVSSVLPLLEMGRLKLGIFATSSHLQCRRYSAYHRAF